MPIEIGEEIDKVKVEWDVPSFTLRATPEEICSSFGRNQASP